MEKFVKIQDGKVSVVELSIEEDDLINLFTKTLVNNHLFNPSGEFDVGLINDFGEKLAREAFRMLLQDNRLYKMLSVDGVLTACKNQEIEGYENIIPVQELLAQIKQNMSFEEFRKLVDKA